MSDLARRSRCSYTRRQSTAPISLNAAASSTLNSTCGRLFVAGFHVRLPDDIRPYPTQKLMLTRILVSLRNKLNALIESPTGSGKTLALLASTCAWLEKHNDERVQRRDACPLHGNGGADPVVTTLPAAKRGKSPVLVELDENGMDTARDVMELAGCSKSVSPFLDQENGLGDDDFVARSDSPIANANKKRAIDVLDTPVTTKRSKGDESEKAAKECACSQKVWIYYCTRTHRQISQVVKEFARLPYSSHLQHTILASREQSCINRDVRRAPDITARCKETIGRGGLGCAMKNALKEKYEGKPQSLRQFIRTTSDANAQVWDMEDLVQTLSTTTQPLCPYFASTQILAKDADIVFCPFNYLVDPVIRDASQVHLKNAIVILDEAHNVEDVCRAAASFDFDEREIAESIDHLEEHQLTLGTKLSKSATIDYDATTGDDENGLHLQMLQFSSSFTTVLEFAKEFRRWFHSVGSEVAQTAVKPGDRHAKTYTWEYLATSLKRASEWDLLFDRKSERFKKIQKALAMLLDRRNEDGDNGGSTYQELNDCRPKSGAVRFIDKFFSFLDFFTADNFKHRATYKMFVCVEKANPRAAMDSSFFTKRESVSSSGKISSCSANSDWGESKSQWLSAKGRHDPVKQGYRTQISMWCMSPAVAFLSAFADCRSVILASGTLCPTETFRTELGIEFKSQMEGDQVIPRERIFAAVVNKGPNDRTLRATYTNVNDGSQYFMRELALVVNAVCEVVPRGVLCFLPSYSMLDKLMQYMDENAILRKIQLKKVVICEPRRSSELADAMTRYETAVGSARVARAGTSSIDGALMLAVFRGKVSEGIDFTDDRARCVIAVGIPFPNAMDEQVKEKKIYNDQLNRGNKKLLDGDQWYTTQAYRALNQALGRCLRHRGDWGALVLVDERFLQNGGGKISKWVREQLCTYPSFRNFQGALGQFVQRMTQDDASTSS